MELWNLITSGKRIEEMKMAYIGKHIFRNKLSPSLQNEVHNLANENANRFFSLAAQQN